MDIADKLNNILKKEKKKFSDDKNFSELIKKIDVLKQKNILKKSEYSLPAIDTFGERLYGSQSNCKN